VEQRQDAEHALASRRALGVVRDDLLGIGEDVAMGQDRALGRSGRAAGILQHGDILGRDGDRFRRRRARQQARPGDVAAVGRHPRLLLALEDAVQRGLAARQHLGEAAHNKRAKAAGLRHPGHLGVDVGDVDHEHHAGPGIADLMFELALDVERIVIDHHAARLEHRVIGDDSEGRVGQAQPDAISFGEAPRLQTSRQSVGCGSNLAIGPAATKEIDRWATGMKRGCPRQGLMGPTRPSRAVVQHRQQLPRHAGSARTVRVLYRIHMTLR